MTALTNSTTSSSSVSDVVVSTATQTNITTAPVNITTTPITAATNFDNINGQDNIWKELVGTWASQGQTWAEYIEQTSLTNV